MIGDAVDSYVALIRAGGGRYRMEPFYLAKYAAFAQARGDTHVRIQTVLEWTRCFPSAPHRRELLLMVRRFALSVAAEDPRHEVPPVDLLPRAPRVRRKPYIYSPAEIASLVAMADECATVGCPVPGQYRTLFGLIAATGLRRGEALAIDIGDITAEGLMIRPMKRSGWRRLPLHPTVEAQLARHVQARAQVPAETASLFLADGLGRMVPEVAYDVFRRMLERTGLAGKADGGRNPRIHDLRHYYRIRLIPESTPEAGGERASEAIDSGVITGCSGMPARHRRAGIVRPASVCPVCEPWPALSVSGRRADRCT